MSVTFSQKKRISSQISAVLGMLFLFVPWKQINKQILSAYTNKCKCKCKQIISAYFKSLFDYKYVINLKKKKKFQHVVLKVFVSFESIDRILNWIEILWLCWIWTVPAIWWRGVGGPPEPAWAQQSSAQPVTPRQFPQSELAPSEWDSGGFIFSALPSQSLFQHTPKGYLCTEAGQNTQWASKHLPCREEQDPALDIHPHITLQAS